MIYLITTLILLVIAFGCFRNYSKGNIIPTCIITFLAASIISAIIYSIEFSMNEDRHVYNVKEYDYKPGKLEIKKNEVWVRGGCVEITDDILVERDTISYVKEITLEDTYELSKGMLDVCIDIETKKILYLNETDYKTLSDTLEKRGISLEVDEENV